MTKHYNKSSQTEKRRKLRREQTYVEKIVWIQLRNRNLKRYKFKRQYSIDHFVMDFYCSELKLAIELDGEVHNQTERQEYDRARQTYLEKFGITFIRIKNEDFLGNADREVKRIKRMIEKIIGKV